MSGSDETTTIVVDPIAFRALIADRLPADDQEKVDGVCAIFDKADADGTRHYLTDEDDEYRTYDTTMMQIFDDAELVAAIETARGKEYLYNVAEGQLEIIRDECGVPDADAEANTEDVTDAADPETGTTDVDVV